MSLHQNTPTESLPPEWSEAVDEVVERFEVAWHSGERLDIADIVPQDVPYRRMLLSELIQVEWELRVKAGDEVDDAAYRSRFPELADDETLWQQLRAERRLLLQRRSESGSSPTEAFGSFAPGMTLGNYTIIEPLGQGGMGLVFKATHRTMKRTVALKVVAPKTGWTAESLDRFRREVETVARLSHPNIVTAHDADDVNGVRFLVMELVHGTDLSRLVRERGPLSVEQAVEVILQAARGLEHAHAEGIIHRDIKPGNLILSDKGVVKVLDLGLARWQTVPVDSAQDHSLTESGQVVGTVDYMSPEQALNTKHADARSDIYSLGCTLWFLLTGRPVYGGDSAMERLVAHREQPIPNVAVSLRETKAERETDAEPHSTSIVNRDRDCATADPHAKREGYIEQLDSLFRRMVAKKPDERLQTMTEVIAACESLLESVGLRPSASITTGALAASRLSQSGSTEVGDPLPPPPASGDTQPSAMSAEQETLIQSASALAKSKSRSRRVLWLWTSTLTLLFVAVTVWQFKGPSGSESNSGVPAKLNSEPPDPAAERSTAEWVLSVGGTIAVRVGDERIEVTDTKQLPTREFQLIQVLLRQPQGLTQPDFERFRGLQNLEYFEASDVIGIRDDWLSPLSGLPRLKSLRLTSGGVNDLMISDAIVPLLQSLPNLEEFELYQDGLLTNAGVAEIAKLPKLRLFGSMSPALTDEVWEAFANTPVNSLRLHATNLTSQSVIFAARCPQLEFIIVHGKYLTKEGIAALRSCSSLRGLGISGVDAADDLASDIANLSQLRMVLILSSQLSDSGVAALASLPQLDYLELGRVPVTDQGLQHLQSCRQLANLSLFVTKVTPAGLAKFKAARPDVHVNSDIPEADIPPPWPLGPSENVIPGLVARPTKLPGIKRWQVTTNASRGQASLGLAWGRQGEIAVGGQDGLIRLFDPQELRLVRVIDAHQRSGGPSGAEVLALDWSADGASLVSAGREAVRVWDRSGRQVREWKGYGATSVSWHPDGKRHAIGNGAEISVLSVEREFAEQRLSESVGGSWATVRWSPNGEWLAAWQETGDGTAPVRLWKADGSLGPTLGENIPGAYTITWSSDSTRLACSSMDGKVRVWSVGGESLATWDTQETQVHGVAWHPTQSLIAANKLGGSVYLWNLDQPSEPPRRWNNGGQLISRVAWNSAGTELVAIDGTASLQVLDIKLQPLRHRRGTLNNTDNGRLAWSPNSDRLLMGGNDGQLRVWSNSGLLRQAVLIHDSGFHGMAWSPDASRLVVTQQGKGSFAWLDGTTLAGMPVATPATVAYDVAWHSDSRAFALIVNPGKLLLFDGNAKLTKEIMAHEGEVLAVDWSADDEFIATGGRDRRIRIWRPSGERVAELERHTDAILDVAWSPRGDRLASCGGDDIIRLWNRDGSLRKVIGDNDRPISDMHRWGVHGLAWRPDGDRFVSCSVDGTVRLWSDNGEPLGQYPAPVWEQFTGIAWTRDSKWIAARSLFNVVYVWNAETRALAWHSVLLPGGRAVTFSPAGELLTGDLHLLTDAQRTTLGIDKADAPDLALAKSLDQDLIYILERDDGQQELLKPSEFFRRTTTATVADSERVAAEWVLSVGGQVTIQQEGLPPSVPAQGKLPPGAFRILAVKFDGGDVTDAGLLKLRGLSSLADLRLTNTPRVTPKGMQVVTSLPVLELLILDNKSFTDDHILPLRDCRKLVHLNMNVSVTDSAANVLTQLPELRYLGLTQSQFTNEGLKRLLAAPKLSEMEIANERITDEGLLLLANDPRWTSLNLGHPLTPKGIEYLGRLPNLKFFGLTGILPNGSFDVSRLPQLQTLSFSRGGNVREFTAEHFSWLARFQQIEALEFRYFTDIDLPGLNDLSKLNRLWFIGVESVPLTDEGLARLVEIRSLKQVALRNTKVTPAGLAKFKAARPDVKVEGDVAAIDYAAERVAAEWVLSVGGIVGVRIGEQRVEITKSDQLPSGPFDLIEVVIYETRGVTREGLNCLRGRVALEHLALVSVTGMTDEWLDSVKGLPKLRAIKLYDRGGRITDAIIPVLRTLPLLRDFESSLCHLSDAGYSQLATLPNLRVIGFQCREITDAAVEPFVNTQVESVTLESGHTKLTPHSVELAARFPRLESLNVAGDLLSDQSAEALRSCATLKSLGVMQGNDATLARVAKLGQIVNLALQHNQDSQDFTDVGIGHLKSLPRLASLNCAFVAMTDAGLDHIAAIPSLKEFRVFNSRITPAGLAKFKAARPDVKVECDVAALDPAAERAAAEWVLNRGEEVSVRVDGQVRHVRTLAELPSEAFVVTLVILRKAEPISEEGMQRLAKLSQLEDLWLHGVPNSGELIKALPPQSSLKGLYTSEISRSDGVIESLRRHPQLKALHLTGTRWIDRDFEQLAALSGLTLLNLDGTGVTDQQLTHIATLPDLNDLTLSNNADLSSVGIRSLSSLPQLRRILFFNADESAVIAATELPHLTSLEVGVVEFTDKVIDSLATSRITKLTLNGNVPVSKWQPLNREFCQQLSRLKQLDSLRLVFFRDQEAKPAIEPGAITTLATLPQLKELVVEAAPLTDDDLLTLTEFKALRQLTLAHTKVTPAGLAKFKAARPEVTVEGDVQ